MTQLFLQCLVEFSILFLTQVVKCTPFGCGALLKFNMEVIFSMKRELR
jgi:hypothetical protein